VELDLHSADRGKGLNKVFCSQSNNLIRTECTEFCRRDPITTCLLFTRSTGVLVRLLVGYHCIVGTRSTSISLHSH
jgi:hypothetical protein